LNIATIKHNQINIVYPNPAQDYITIQTNNQTENKISIAIYDELSRSKFTKTLSIQNGKAILNVEELTNGIYFVKTTLGAVFKISKLSSTN
jgi:vancomycin resistance protein YoaR